MAAKPKMTLDEWAQARATWEADPRKPTAWLIEELSLPVSGEALRLRAKADGWEKAEGGIPKLGNEKSKLGNPKKSKLVPEIPSLDGIDVGEVEGSPVALVAVPSIDTGGTLTPNEGRFVLEYMIDLNGTQAYMRAYPESAEPAARSSAARLLAKANVALAVEKAKTERAARTGITADRALAEVWAVATADPRELVQVKVGCCRCCYGEGYGRQRTVGEMNRDREKHTTKGKELADFDEEGGIGFNPHLPPNPECPDCCGDGNARVVLTDTRNLSPAAVALYAGARQGKFGIEVLLQGKAEAQRKVFEHLGLNKQVVEVSLNLFPPAEVLDAIHAKALAEAAEREKMLRGRRERLGIVIENGEAYD